MKKIAVVLSGCGVYDGAEIYETVITLLSIEEFGAKYQCIAPNIDQMHVINHHTGEVSDNECRNVLIESARLARGDVIDLDQADPSDYDALIIPGGFGAAKNLSDFAIQGEKSKAHDKLVEFSKEIHMQGKPVGLMCIAPAIAPFIFGEKVDFTIGSDVETAKTIESIGGVHRECDVSDIVVDEQHKVVTTPAYMSANSISEAAVGIRKLVNKVVDLTA
mgnify:CR=1 FL=1